MGDKDIAEKMLESYNDVFADIVNGLVFDGEQIIKEDELTDATQKEFPRDHASAILGIQETMDESTAPAGG